MTIPAEFNDVEHLQTTIRRYLNRVIKEDFAELNDNTGNWTPSVSSTRGAMRHALTHKDNDPIQVTIARMMLYYFTYSGAAHLQAPVYGVPTYIFDERFTYKPQITLFFRQDKNTVGTGKNAAEGEISFRLMNETSTSLTQTEVNNYATKVKNNFTNPTNFTWSKGRAKATYTDMEKGYQLKLLVTTKAEAKSVITAVLTIQGHTPDWEFLNFQENDDAASRYPDVPGSQVILGKTVKKPRKRPIENVKFRYATLLIHGLPAPITLVDTTYRRPNAILRV